ncbi:PucR family transcriptional regulator, partial [Microbacterium sp.]|uniref:PucR family transcriptional regulator n=1 Tax=Microbacterium sp. TaxID=51671 RepID=UPI003C77511C
LSGAYASAGELDARALGAGVRMRHGQRAVALCVRSRMRHAGSARTLIAVRTAAQRQLGAALVAEHDGDVLVGAVVPGRVHRPAVIAFADDLRRELGAAAGSVLVAASSPVDTIPDLVGALPAAIQTAGLALRLAAGADVVFAPDFALFQMLVSLVDDVALERFVNEQLGPLLEYDARTGAGLVVTLDAYLGSGLSKTRTADILGLRRQSLYGRLERISALLGGVDLDNRDRRTALDLALVSWRLRATGARRASGTRA